MRFYSRKDGGRASFVDRLEPLLVRGDIGSAREMLASLSGEELLEAKTWFVRGKRWIGKLHTLQYEGADQDERYANLYNARWIIAMAAVALCDSATAATRVPWRDLWSYRGDAGEREFVAMLCATDREWARDFAEAAALVDLGADTRYIGITFTRVVRAILVHHELPAPKGSTFYASWLSGGPAWPADGDASMPPSTEGAVEDARLLASDPLMPGLLFGYLASGHCGQGLWLPAATAELVRNGDVDRGALIEHILSLLTARQQPKSQAVLARILSGLDVRAEEVRGGLTYLLGVMDASHGSVTSVLLPLAVESVSDGSELAELTRLIAGRHEVRQKNDLLHRIQSESVRAAIGVEAIAEALTVLGQGDASFDERVAQAHQRLRFATAMNGRPAPSGLWDAAPVVVEPNTQYFLGPYWARTWSDLLDKSRSFVDDDYLRLGDELLSEMAQLHFDTDLFVDQLRPLLGGGRFATGEFAARFNDIFLSGGLRQGWSAALGVAEAACLVARPPNDLWKLLRMLASFAHEVPPQELPLAIAQLAASDGGTNAHVEARQLGAVLAGCDVEMFVAKLRSSSESRSSQPRARGLWREDDELEPLPSQRHVVPVSSDLDELRAALVEALGAHSGPVDMHVTPPPHAQPYPPSDLTTPDLVLAAAVQAIHRHGAEAVRRALFGKIPRGAEPPDVFLAIDLWVAGKLDTALYWRVARKPLALHLVMNEIARRVSMIPDEREKVTISAHFRALPGDPDSAMVPPALYDAAARLAFLRACESLLLAETNPIVFATPTWEDGTIEFGDLVARLAGLNGAEVGPLDLVQALYRLRDVSAADLDLLDLAPAHTCAALTSYEGETSWQAIDVVREWVTNGGLPVLEPVAVNGKWTTSTAAPVPWTRCAALPKLLRNDPWNWSANMSIQLRLAPRWADRVFPTAHCGAGLVPSQASGPFGEPFHDAVLGYLAATSHRAADGILGILDLARRNRLDPDTVVAAALGRNAAGVLMLDRLSYGFAEVAEYGGLRGLWPSMVAIAGALAQVTTDEPGLAQFLQMLNTYIVEVPRPELLKIGVPDELRHYAVSAGTTSSHIEARAFVAAVDGR